MTEDQLEQETLGWLQDVGYTHRYGPDIAFDGPNPERANYRQVLLTFRLREAIHKHRTSCACQGRKPLPRKHWREPSIRSHYVFYSVMRTFRLGYRPI